jgi:hypothetical protein
LQQLIQRNDLFVSLSVERIAGLAQVSLAATVLVNDRFGIRPDGIDVVAGDLYRISFNKLCDVTVVIGGNAQK